MNGVDIVLDVKGLSSGYGRVPVLRNVDLQIGDTEIVGVLGHNGMGKTTLLKTIMGFVPASSGSVEWDNTNIVAMAPNERAQAGIGYVPQGRGIFPNLSVLDNLRFAYQDLGQESEDEMVANILTDFPRLKHLLDRAGGALSGGEQQLLALARCLMGAPSLLLLDEPTEGIQPSIIEEIAETLRTLNRDKGLAIVLVEQNFDFVSDLADRAIVLERGEVKAELSRTDLTDKAQVEAFLGLGAVRRTQRSTNPGMGGHSTGGTPDKSPSRPPEIQAAVQVMHMSIKRPTIEQMRGMAERMGFSMSDEELGSYLNIMEPFIQGYDRIDASPDYLPEVRYPRAPGYRPLPAENTLNAWYYKTDIKGAAHGPLAGKHIALKDTVCVAGVPMMNGSSIMEGYTPEIDATIVTRILDAGGTIAGKAHCENLCLSGGSHTNATGPVHNPYKHGYMAGGSSSGSAALVAAGDVDMAVGGDQGGSIRIPSSNCGCYGMKPTHGLVPYTGIMPIEQTIDHVGPITNNVADNALFLEVLAGEDDLDPRQYKPKVYKYTEALGKGAAGLRIGMLKEGFGRPESEADVDAKVIAASEKFRELGARVEEISVPEHLFGPDLWTTIAVEGLQDLMMHGNGSGTNYRGLFLPSMTDHFASWRSRTGELSPSLKVCMFLGEYFQTQYRGRFYGKAQNLSRMLANKYRDAFKSYDLLLMPTLPMKAQKIPPADAPIELYIQRALEMVGNTAPFNASGFPAMTLPCGMSEGLPVGAMLVAANYGEMTIYRAADAFEQIGDWRTF